MELIAVCYYTDERYRAESDRLAASCERFGVPLTCYQMPDLGSWAKNCTHKPDVILRAMHESPADIIYLDADAELARPIPPIEFGAAAYPQWHDTFPCLGTILVRNSALGREFIQDWKASLDAPASSIFPDHRQKHFAGTELPGFCQIMAKWGKSVTVIPLTWYAPDKLINQKDAIILQHQASRRFRKLRSRGKLTA